jgi:hypothetical protein
MVLGAQEAQGRERAVGLARRRDTGVGRLRDLLRHLNASDTLIEVTLSLMTPYAACLVADRAGVSGVLAVVAAGLYSGWRDPVRMDAETRQNTYGVWSLLIFWLNGAIIRRDPPSAPAAPPDHEESMLHGSKPEPED